MRRKRPIKFFVVSILFLLASLYLIFNFSPSSSLPIGNFQIQVLPFFIFLSFLFIFTFLSFVFGNKRRGFLIACFVLGYEILKLMNLAYPFFIILLFILLIVIELMFIKRK